MKHFFKVLIAGLMLSNVFTPVQANSMAGAQMVSTAANQPERIVWDRTPIAIDIQVNTERRIEFPEYVEIKLPKAISTRSTIKLLGDGVMYWRVNQPFQRTQVEVVAASGYQYLLNIEGTEYASPTHPLIVLDKRYKQAEFDRMEIEPLVGVPMGGYDEIAVQRMLAHKILRSVPKRVALNLPGVVSVPLEQKPLKLYQSGELQATPITQLKAPYPHALYVTALRLTNKMSYSVNFDPLAILGDFKAVTALRETPVIHAKGEEGDSLVILLVSERSFMESLSWR